MDTSRIYDIFPFLRGKVNLDDRRQRYILAAGCALAALITGTGAYFALRSDRTETTADEPQAQSVTLSTPQGEDLDVTDIEDKVKIYTETSRDNYGERIFSDAVGYGAIISTISSKIDSITPESTPKEEQEKPGVTPEDPLGIKAAVEKQRNEIEQHNAEATRPATPAVPLPPSPFEDNELAAMRQQMIAAGYDPDTGLPLTDERRDALEGKEESVTTPEEPNEDIAPRAIIRRSGGVSSLDDEWSDAGGVSNMDDNTSLIDSNKSHPFEVMFPKDEKLVAGGRITVRLLEEMVVDGIRIPENTPLTGICSIGGGRLNITFNAIKVGSRIYTLNLEAYDTDGLRGLYCPQTTANAAGKQTRNEMGNIVRSALNSGIAGYAGQVVSAGASVIQSATGTTTISVASGYKFYLLRKH